MPGTCLAYHKCEDVIINIPVGSAWELHPVILYGVA